MYAINIDTNLHLYTNIKTMKMMVKDKSRLGKNNRNKIENIINVRKKHIVMTWETYNMRP